MTRDIRIIAAEIATDWPAATKKVPDIFSPGRMTHGNAAGPYLEAMLTGDYGIDNPKHAILYFLSNAAAWRGETARRIKAELKEMTK